MTDHMRFGRITTVDDGGAKSGMKTMRSGAGASAACNPGKPSRRPSRKEYGAVSHECPASAKTRLLICPALGTHHSCDQHHVHSRSAISFQHTLYEDGVSAYPRTARASQLAVRAVRRGWRKRLPTSCARISAGDSDSVTVYVHDGAARAHRVARCKPLSSFMSDPIPRRTLADRNRTQETSPYPSSPRVFTGSAAAVQLHLRSNTRTQRTTAHALLCSAAPRSQAFVCRKKPPARVMAPLAPAAAMCARISVSLRSV